MKTRGTLLLLTLMALATLSCAHPPAPAAVSFGESSAYEEAALRPADQAAVLIELVGTSIIVTPPDLKVEHRGQEIIWAALDPTLEFDVEMSAANGGRRCNRARGACRGNRFGAGRRIIKYDVTVYPAGKDAITLDPTLIILY